MAQVAVQVQRAVKAGMQSFSIRLEPAELGRIDVRLDFARDGSLRAAFRVERADTLDLLQRDIQGLERSLKDFGGEGQKVSLDLSLGSDAGDRNKSFREALAGESRSERDGTPDSEALTPLDSAELEPIRQATGLVDISI